MPYMMNIFMYKIEEPSVEQSVAVPAEDSQQCVMFTEIWLPSSIQSKAAPAACSPLFTSHCTGLRHLQDSRAV